MTDIAPDSSFLSKLHDEEASKTAMALANSSGRSSTTGHMPPIEAKSSQSDNFSPLKAQSETGQTNSVAAHRRSLRSQQNNQLVQQQDTIQHKLNQLVQKQMRDSAHKTEISGG